MGSGTLGTAYSGPTTRAERATELVGNADGEVGIFSTWFKIDGGNNTQRVIFQGSPITGNHLVELSPLPFIGSGDKIQIILKKSTGAFAVFGRSTQNFVANPMWHHLLISWDTGLTSGTPRLTMHIDDVLEPLSPVLVSPGVIDYTRGNYSIGGRSVSPQSLTFQGCLSEFYFNSVATLDTSMLAERRKFINASGLPVELGSDGSTPTGAAPIIYVPDGDATTNAGSGGSFVNVGVIGPCVDAPVSVPDTATDIIEIIRDEMIAFPKPTQKLAQELQQAIDSLNAALAFLDGNNPRFAAKQVRKAIKNVVFLTNKGLLSDAQGLDWNERLTAAIRIEAFDAIDEAVARTGDPVEIALAIDFLAEGDLEASMGLGFFDDAVKEYEKAILHGELA